MKSLFCSFVLLGMWCGESWGQQASRRDEVLRNAALAAPLLLLSQNGDALAYQVIRFDSPGVRYGGQRYGLVRLKLPEGAARPVVWLFSDVGNIDEYDMLPLRGGPDRSAVRGSMRVIYPALSSLDSEVEAGRRARSLSFPRPWDLFETHLLGVPAERLKGETEFILWFRFGDARPADVLMAARVLDEGTEMQPGLLPAWMGLPELGGE
jgi:hypothetical protein